MIAYQATAGARMRGTRPGAGLSGRSAHARLPRLPVGRLHSREAAQAYGAAPPWLDDLVRLWEVYPQYGGSPAAAAAARQAQPIPDWFTDDLFAVLFRDALASSRLSESQTTALVARLWAGREGGDVAGPFVRQVTAVVHAPGRKPDTRTCRPTPEWNGPTSRVNDRYIRRPRLSYVQSSHGPPDEHPLDFRTGPRVSPHCVTPDQTA